MLEARLIQRWLGMGQDLQGAIAKARYKDMPNARLIKTESVEPDILWY